MVAAVIGAAVDIGAVAVGAAVDGTADGVAVVSDAAGAVRASMEVRSSLALMAGVSCAVGCRPHGVGNGVGLTAASDQRSPVLRLTRFVPKNALVKMKSG